MKQWELAVLRRLKLIWTPEEEDESILYTFLLNPYERVTHRIWFIPDFLDDATTAFDRSVSCDWGDTWELTGWAIGDEQLFQEIKVMTT